MRWQNDLVQFRHPNWDGCANQVSINQAKQTYREKSYLKPRCTRTVAFLCPFCPDEAQHRPHLTATHRANKKKRRHILRCNAFFWWAVRNSNP